MSATTAPLQSASLYLSQLVLNARHPDARRALTDPRGFYRLLLGAFDPDSLSHHNGTALSEKRGLLYRVEPPAPGLPPRVLVQSAAEPHWSRLPPGMVQLDDERTGARPYAPRLAAGQRLRFRLRAVATVSVAQKDTDGGRRRGKERVAYWRVIADEGMISQIKAAAAAGDHATHERLTRIKAARIENALIDWLSRALDGAATLANAEADNWLNFGDDTAGQPVRDVRVTRESGLFVSRDTGTSQPTLAHRGHRKPHLSPVLFDGHLVVSNSESLLQLVHRGVGRAKAFGCGLLSLARD